MARPSKKTRKTSDIGRYILRLLSHGALHRDDIKAKVRKRFPRLRNVERIIYVEMRKLIKYSRVEKLGRSIYGFSKGLGIESALEGFSLNDLNDEELKDTLNHALKGKGGIYALYDKKDSLVYIGIAKRFLIRLDNHSKGRLADKWCKLSLYVTPSKEDARGIEALFLRIYRPKYNRVAGRLGKKVADIGKEAANKHTQIARKLRNR
jgi:hypothetical protein